MNRMARVATMAAGLACMFTQGGCAVGCGATSDRLASLRRGMSYDEASAVMGCPGTLLTNPDPAGGAFAIVEWSGPDSRVFSWTQLDFLDGKLLSYSTGRRGAL
jgi:hypothetical protein